MEADGAGSPTPRAHQSAWASEICEVVVRELEVSLTAHHDRLFQISQDARWEALELRQRLDRLLDEETALAPKQQSQPGRWLPCGKDDQAGEIRNAWPKQQATPGPPARKPPLLPNEVDASEASPCQVPRSPAAGLTSVVPLPGRPSKKSESRRPHSSRRMSAWVKGNSKHKHAKCELAEDAKDLSLLAWLQTRLSAFLSSPLFELLSTLLIFSNVVFCGLEAEILSHGVSDEKKRTLDVVSIIFNALFLVEFLLLICAHGRAHFGTPDFTWHVFDAVVVFVGVLEMILFFLTESGGNFSAEYVRVVRLVKIFRLFRVARIMYFFRGLRVLVLSLCHTMRSLVWTVSLLVVILWFFSIVFTTAATEHRLSESFSVSKDEQSLAVQRYFGSLFSTLLTLFKSACAGMDWQDALAALEELEQAWLWMGFFLLYICFTFFAVLNIITGVFCQSAITGAFKNADVVTDELQLHRRLQEQQLMEIWGRLDVDGQGSLNESQFVEAFDESIQISLEVFGIRVHSAPDFFHYLQDAQTHAVIPDSFLRGCLQVQGEAKALDVLLLRQVVRQLGDCIGGLGAFLNHAGAEEC